jgi:xanthine dehydrogenase accessory factor
MIDVYKQLQPALKAGETCVLARIIRQTGSAPRTVGAKLLVQADRRPVGTIGGGLLEHEVLRKAHEVMTSGRPAVLEVRLTGEDAAASEMICGGSVDVLIEPVSSEDTGAASVFQALDEMTAQGRRGVLVTVLAEGRRGVLRAIVTETGRVIGDAPERFKAAGADPKQWAGTRRFALETTAHGAGPLVFVEPVEPEAVLVLFGAGHISTFVAPFARAVDFRVCVIDDREEFANAGRFPNAEQILVCPLTEAFDRIAVTPATYLVIVTRGHIHDRDALRVALTTRPAYLGMIGSRRKRDLIYAALMEEGVAAEDLRRVHCPIGIAIGAETPQEIAISIVAELIQVRAGGGLRTPADALLLSDTRSAHGAVPGS